jgi:hypothetical protein
MCNCTFSSLRILDRVDVRRFALRFSLGDAVQQLLGLSPLDVVQPSAQSVQ